MTAVASRRALLLWPIVALAAMVVVGWAVGRRSTPLDSWFLQFRRTPARELLVFTSPYVLGVLVVVTAVVAALRRKWLTTALVALSPLAGIYLARALKYLFGREKEGDLAYPSGHTTAAAIVLGMVVVVAGASLWAVVASAAYVVLAMVGQGVTYHYFTDTVGALLLGSAVVCVAAVVAKLDTRQPDCDVGHSDR